MGKRNQQRRAARRRAHTRQNAGGRRDHRSVEELLLAASLPAWAGVEQVAAPLVEEIVDRHRRHGVAVAEAVVGELCRSVAAAWERGWQPADLAHVARRKLQTAALEVCAATIAIEARSYRQRGEVDRMWVQQVDAVAPTVTAAPFDHLVAVAGGVAEAVFGAAATLGLLRWVPALPRLVDPPSAWSSRSVRVRQRIGDPQMAARVRALLAKAESTDFDEEAEAFTAKAQELIAKHAIDQAMLDAEEGGGDVVGRRVLLDDPYLKPKSALLAAVAHANRCRTVTSQSLGFSTVFGYPSDVDAVEVLFPSLLTQATAAMVVASRAADRRRVRSFRQAFLIAYADRIGQRLRAAADGAVAEARTVHGDALLPVLAARDDKVDAALDAAFGRLTSQRISISNAAGYAAGRAAADLADLGPSGRLKAG